MQSVHLITLSVRKTCYFEVLLKNILPVRNIMALDCPDDINSSTCTSDYLLDT